MDTTLKTTSRNSTVELLRIILIVFVIVLHTNFECYAIYKTNNPITEFILYVFESISICAVDCFIIISGYYLVKSQRRDVYKIIQLYLLVVSVSCLIQWYHMINKSNINAVNIIRPLIVGNYFLLLYSAVYLLSPYINVIFNFISRRAFVSLLIICSLLFSLWPTFIDVWFKVSPETDKLGYSFVSMFGQDGAGYTLVNFIFMYTIGAYLGKYNIRVNCKVCLSAFILSSAAIFLIHSYSHPFQIPYYSPFVIINAVSLFLMFIKLPVFHNQIINYISSKVFAIFIVHNLVMGQLVYRVIPMDQIVNRSSTYQEIIAYTLFILAVFTISFVISIFITLFAKYIINLIRLYLPSLTYKVDYTNNQ